MKRVALSALLLLGVAATDPASAASYSFDYSASGAGAFGIDRVFDDGKNTVVRFTNSIPAGEAPTVTSADGTPLQTRVIGPYLVLPGLQRHVLLYRRGIVAQVQQGRQDAPYPLPSSPWAAPAANAIPQAPTAAAPRPRTATARTAPVVVTSSVAGIQTSAPVTVGLPSGAAAGMTANPTPAAAVVGTEVAGSLAVINDELPPAPVWESKPGATLRSTTEAWAKQAGWTVRWLLSNGDDYEVVPTTYTGGFTESLSKLYAPYFAPSFNADKPLHVKAYAKPKIIVVSE